MTLAEPRPTTARDHGAWWWAPPLILVATVAQLAVAQWVPGIDRFADKAFGARLVLYPLLMLLAPAAWWLLAGRRGRGVAVPHGAFALVMLGFLVDVSGNSLDLYDAVSWWDDLNHLVNWFFLLTGIGLLVAARVRPRWAVVALVTGLGAALAIGWEVGEWATFIRHGTELGSAYEDTLGDEALGTLGALLAGFVVAGSRRPAPGRMTERMTGRTAGRAAGPVVFAAAWLALVALLVAQTVTPGRFGDPAAAYRLAAYPLLALAAPVAWAGLRPARPTPWVGFTLLALPFLVDTVGNIGDLYARIGWWDDVNHVVNWGWLGAGLWLLLGPAVRPRAAALAMVAGLGAALAVAWEVFERLAFYGPGAAASVYEDTLADQVLGTAGGLLGALVALLLTTGRDASSSTGRMRG